MRTDKKLVEAIASQMSADPAWLNNSFFRRVLKLKKETILAGNVTDDTGSTAAVAMNDILSTILMGVEGYESLDWVKQYATDKAIFSVPVGTYGAASTMSSGAFTDANKSTSNIDFTLDEEYGIQTTWTRSHLEDASWDVLAEQTQNAGYAIKKKLIELCIAPIAALTSTLAGGGIVDLSSSITWAEFTGLCARVDAAGTGPADYAVCSPTIYWQLLLLDQFVNSLYAGTDEVMRSGIAKTTLGVTVIRSSDMEADAIFVLNSKKAVGLVTRRAIKVEPFEHPESNQYGFIASTRAKAGVLVPSAIAVGETTV